MVSNLLAPVANGAEPPQQAWRGSCVRPEPGVGLQPLVLGRFLTRVSSVGSAGRTGVAVREPDEESAAPRRSLAQQRGCPRCFCQNQSRVRSGGSEPATRTPADFNDCITQRRPRLPQRRQWSPLF